MTDESKKIKMSGSKRRSHLGIDVSKWTGSNLGIKKVIVDGGYSGAYFADFVKTVYGADVAVV